MDVVDAETPVESNQSTATRLTLRQRRRLEESEVTSRILKNERTERGSGRRSLLV